MRDHRNLRAFELADALVLSVYQETHGFPKDEMYGLTSQMRRAAVSVCANIVEGCGREGPAEYAHFLNMALGSLRELGYYIDLARRLGYLSAEKAPPLAAQYEEAAKVLSGLNKSLRKGR